MANTFKSYADLHDNDSLAVTPAEREIVDRIVNALLIDRTNRKVTTAQLRNVGTGLRNQAAMDKETTFRGETLSVAVARELGKVLARLN